MKKISGFLFVASLAIVFLSSCGSHSEPQGTPITPAEKKIPLPDLSPATPYNVKTITGIPIVRPDDPDKVKLYVDVVLPDSDGTFPTLLYATAYRREFFRLITADSLVPYGYAMVFLDVVGTGSSEGKWEVFSQREIDDIVYLIDQWIPEQAWSNGKVGMYGPSYMGIASLLAAGRRPEHLKVIFPSVAMANAYRDIFFQGGIFNQEFIYFWGRVTVDLSEMLPTQLVSPRPDHFVEDISCRVTARREHKEQEQEVLGYASMDLDSEFFDIRSPENYWDEIAHFPTFISAGWWDLFTRGSMLNYTGIAESGRRESTAQPLKIIVGPWYHITGALGAGIPFDQLERRWFDWHLKADNDPHYRDYDILDPGAPVILYVLGREQWRREKEWPLLRARYEGLYLSGRRQQSDANESLNNGSLLWADENVQSQEEPTRITYDPNQEREKFTGQKSRSWVRWALGIPFLSPYAEDEHENEKYLLTFSTAPLDRDVEMTGPAVLRLYARSQFGTPLDDPPPIWFEEGNRYKVDSTILKPWAQGQDVHWTVNLNDVSPSGQVRNITSGWLAASHRPDPTRPDWTEPGYDPLLYPEDRDPIPPESGQIYEYVIEIWPLSNVFKQGHQVRIDIAVTDYPHFLPSLVPSANEIFHDAAYPSRLILPVVDADSTDPRQWIDDPQAFFSGKEETWVDF